MSTAKGEARGFAPSLKTAPTEKSKYEQMWARREYRAVSPGEQVSFLFREVVRPVKGADAIDFGCGTGRGGHALAMFCKLNVTLVDFAGNCLDKDVKEAIEEFPDRLKFIEHDLTKPLDIKARYGYCTDVMEHIPPEQVDAVLENILTATRSCFFQIACADDVCGALIGEPLHLSVHDHRWWKEKLEAHGAFIRWSRDNKDNCLFYVSRFARPRDYLENMVINAGEDALLANTKANMALGLQEAKPCETQSGLEIMILAGGPSLNDFEGEIIERRTNGMPLVTVNGTYNWAIERGLKPSAQIIADGREFNKRFVVPHVEGCKYLLASVCHPEVIAAAPQDRVWLWHPNSSPEILEALRSFPGDRFPVHGGSTVMLRALPLMRMLGFQKFHIYGWDSCIRPDAHHAYAQPENESENIVEITAGNRTFQCHPWMSAQAEEFITLTRMLGDECELEVYGDGLIAEIIKSNAE